MNTLARRVPLNLPGERWLPGSDAALRRLRFNGLVRELVAFYQVLAVERARVEADAAHNPITEEEAAAAARALLDRLEALLQGQWEIGRQRFSDQELSLLREAQYVMCALADDLFLHDVLWPGREAWSASLLELRMFGSRIAGEWFFDKATRIERDRDRAAVELAPLYLMALGLGFRGRHRGEAGIEHLRRHAAALFEVATGREADPMMYGMPIAPQAIAAVASGRPTPQYRLQASWPTLTAAVVGGFVVISTILWFVMTGPIWTAADAVFNAAR